MNVTKHMGSRTLFADISWQLQRGDRIGLVGPNGAGKTTLMRMIIGEESLDGGQISCSRDESIGYLPQEAPRHNEGTVLERVLQAATQIQALGQRIAELEKALSHSPADQAAELSMQHGELLERYRLLDGFTLEARAREILGGLGFAAATMDAPLKSLSGGWWMRVELARLLLIRPDYLLLDEPTNHLDLESIAWLEKFLEGYAGAWVVVSHDRYFLNGVVSGIAELSADGLFVFPGTYDDYQEARAEIAERLAAEARNHAKRVAVIESFVERFRYKSTKARQVQSRIKLLERTEAPAAVPKKHRALRIKLPGCERAGDIVATLEGIGKHYGERVVYNDLNLQVRRGDKIALVGPNGAGKSTLLKILADVVQPDAGTRQLGHNVQTYYFAQHQLDILDSRKTVMAEMHDAMPLESISRVRGILGAFLFSDDAVDKQVGVLSGGEKIRLALAKMLARPANLLLLDEPTNHLDLDSRDVLESAIADFDGTVVFISHDRYFINHIANQIVEVRPGAGIHAYAGDYDYYLWKTLHPDVGAASADSPAPTAAKGKSDRAQEHEARKQAQRDLARREKEAQKLEEAIHKAEARLKDIDALMCDPEVYNDGPRCKELMQERTTLDDSMLQLYTRWEELSSSTNSAKTS